MNRILTDDIHKIVMYMQDRNDAVALTPVQRAKLDRMIQTSDLIRQYGSRLKVVPMIAKQFNVSEATAHTDFEDTTYVFATVKKTGDQNFWVDILIGFILETRRNAITIKDFKTAERCERNMLDLIERFLGDKDVLPYDKFQPPVTMFGFYTEHLNVQLPKDYKKQIAALLKNKKKKFISSIDVTDESAGD